MNEKTPYYYNWLSKDLGVAVIRQELFGAIIEGKKRWQVDISAGTIAFDDMVFPVAFLGSESYGANSWLWGWVNVNEYPEAIYKDSEKFYQIFMMQQMDELKEAELPLTDLINGHAIASMAIVASTEPMCYYKAPYEGGAAFMLVKGVPKTVFRIVPAHMAAQVITQAIKAFPVHHKYLVDGILEVYATKIEQTATEVSGQFYDGNTVSRLIVSFDEQERICDIRVTMDN